MTVEWVDIEFSKADQPYVLAVPSPAQRRRQVGRRWVGWRQVARFITGMVERQARRIHKVAMARYDRACELSREAIEWARIEQRDAVAQVFGLQVQDVEGDAAWAAT